MLLVSKRGRDEKELPENCNGAPPQR